MLPFPIAAGVLGHAVRWSLILLAGANVATGALVACMLVSIMVRPVVDRLHLPFAALAFSAVVSMIPSFFVSRLQVPSSNSFQWRRVRRLTNLAANGATAFLIIFAMTLGLIPPRMLLEKHS